MKFPASMLLVATLMGATTLAAVTPVGAAERLSDVDYVFASRCAGLARGAQLDTTSLVKLLKEQGRGRYFNVQDQADSKREDAYRWAYRAKTHGERSLDGELSACKAYIGADTTVATMAVAR